MKFTLSTKHPVALHSLDHTDPDGTRNDNSRNQKFNDKVYRLLERGRPLFVLDLGCAGGGFVKNCIEDGHFAVGLEGSDYDKHHRLHEWPNIPENLFTCDITKPFEIISDGAVLFDLITSWEVLEHIAECDIAQVALNIHKHLREDGLCILSINLQREVRHHLTIQEKPWWVERFSGCGLHHDESMLEYFGDDWVRGPLQNAPTSFHLILKK